MELTTPTKFLLAQNYPNPFKKETIIKYSIPDKMNVRLELFDIKGNKLKTLVNDIKDAGTHREEFKSDGLDEGEYQYKLECEYYFEIKKMVLLK
jgi:hypothetical protein